MVSEQRELLDEILVKMRVGRMKRRTFLERAAIIGLGGTAALSLLESCSEPGDVINLIWQSENDSTNTYAQLVETYNQTQGREKGIYVTWLQGPDRDSTLLTRYTTTLGTRSNTFDILSLDITYPAQFGTAKWIAPITEDMWPLNERKQHVRGPISGCTYKGKLWAAPYRIDPGVFFYRTDIVGSPPLSYDEMLDLSKEHVPAKAKYGYVWQGGQNEDLVCNFVEVLHGFGGPFWIAAAMCRLTHPRLWLLSRL
ncbi:hypothetical protein [Ktedonospora formicarum]|uniref:Extracellular solute-binding protein n=1 Tax=Ktedonospora formicarum TaxID=2778364 RepID=A0A8J3I4N0_9CHLR|nr:hypothetical protein [Ktedonospora formicarum]GHO49409.1 hypothetical protein KSX_75720 [Ktedonospora formicarum]